VSLTSRPDQVGPRFRGTDCRLAFPPGPGAPTIREVTGLQLPRPRLVGTNLRRQRTLLPVPRGYSRQSLHPRRSSGGWPGRGHDVPKR
jgi:hypothetical protein